MRQYSISLRWLVAAGALLLSTGGINAEIDSPGDTGASTLPKGPDFRQVLSMESASRPQVAPDGGSVVYVVATADWEGNRYDRELWLARTGEDPFQLTRNQGKSSTNPRWSPDGKWIAFLSDRGDDPQIWLISPKGGEALPLTAVKDGIADFEWSPDGKTMAVAITDPEDEHREKLEEAYGAYAVEDADFRMTHLWLLDVEAALASEIGATLPDDSTDESGTDEKLEDAGTLPNDSDTEPPAFRRLTSGGEFTVRDLRFSPDGRRIAFSHTPDPRVESSMHSDISVVEVAGGENRTLVTLGGPDSDPRWSPDGRWVLFSTKNGRSEYYLNNELAKIAIDGGELVVLTAGFDENVGVVSWSADGILFIALDGTYRRLYRMDPSSHEITPVTIDNAPRLIWWADVSADGHTLVFQGEDADSLDEIYRLDDGSTRATRITDMTGQTTDWQVGTREVIQWPSKDGATIEGVLLKPDGFDPNKKHPLLVIVHGGPAWLSLPAHVYTYVYPVQQWLAKGAVVLMPNYRGSAGYGQDFRALNVRNLGVGDAWDVLSGVDHLIEKGFVDLDRMGAMGWSQGGYISAFLTTTSDRFRAISVGAGISNWMTYYVNTDIHPFTRIYLEGTPWNDPEVYAKTSPMAYVAKAVTPTLIQHGEFDRRVPTPNAYELYQGLQDVGAPVELIIYKGFGHGITKPKERLAAVWHNWRFFARWIWNEEVEIPVE